MLAGQVVEQGRKRMGVDRQVDDGGEIEEGEAQARAQGVWLELNQGPLVPVEVYSYNGILNLSY